ncbi:hypothetical protein GXM_04954 [Nostoc sphaeroides CCNUC1]|uniref:Uncharacterized protein n=1 Tax=Nostoc sphaeroides CCNUC1 TaxID=2653204 RepID=A0A5P8W4D1_9NOSO|nr:hypothetical protein GXM_04954 [Nostoc sphaeroides CCNUC1]
MSNFRQGDCQSSLSQRDTSQTLAAGIVLALTGKLAGESSSNKTN